MFNLIAAEVIIILCVTGVVLAITFLVTAFVIVVADWMLKMVEKGKSTNGK